MKAERLGVVLIGHGSPALDCPPRFIGELMSLVWGQEHPGPPVAAAGAGGGHRHQHAGGRAAELDAKIRNWPRGPDNDPYKRGLERVAEALKPLLPTELFAIGYNEFCNPSIAEAVEQLVRQRATRVLVIPSMLTPGGVHAEIDIPRALEALRRTHPEVSIEYVWPFAIDQVAELLASHVERALKAPPAAGAGRVARQS